MEADEACFEEPEEGDTILFVAGEGADVLRAALEGIEEAFERGIRKEGFDLGSDGRNEEGVGATFDEIVGLEELRGVMGEECGEGEANGGWGGKGGMKGLLLELAPEGFVVADDDGPVVALGVLASGFGHAGAQLGGVEEKLETLEEEVFVDGNSLTEEDVICDEVTKLTSGVNGGGSGTPIGRDAVPLDSFLDEVAVTAPVGDDDGEACGHCLDDSETE